MQGASSEYWSWRYAEHAEAHAEQNLLISKDFIASARGNKLFATALRVHSVVEFGCGTGELVAMLTGEFGIPEGLGTDFSLRSVQRATRAYERHGLAFKVHDARQPLGRRFDLSICSNTLEHFKDPFPIVQNMLACSNRAIIIVPYKQPCTDGYDDEGGAGHVYTFDEKTFGDETEGYLLFQSPGWQHSSRGEKPFQMAVLLRPREGNRVSQAST